MTEALIDKSIIKEMGLNSLPAEEQEEMLVRVGELVFRAVVARALQEMKDEDKEAFEKLLGGEGNEDVLIGFLREKVPSLDAIVKEEVENFKQNALSTMEGMTGLGKPEIRP